MMTATDEMKTYKAVFKKIFPNITEEYYEKMKVGDPMEWDSLHQIQLISELERVFSIRLKMEDVLKLRSFQKGIEILTEQYQVRI